MGFTLANKTPNSVPNSESEVVELEAIVSRRLRELGGCGDGVAIGGTGEFCSGSSLVRDRPSSPVKPNRLVKLYPAGTQKLTNSRESEARPTES